MNSKQQGKVNETEDFQREHIIEHVRIENIEVEASNPYVSNQLIRPDPIQELDLYRISTSDPKALNVLVSIISQAVINEIMKNHPLGKLLTNVENFISHPIENGIKKPSKKAGKILKKLLPFGN